MPFPRVVLLKKLSFSSWNVLNRSKACAFLGNISLNNYSKPQVFNSNFGLTTRTAYFFNITAKSFLLLGTIGYKMFKTELCFLCPSGGPRTLPDVSNC